MTCNLYSITTNQAAIIVITRALQDVTGNMPFMLYVFPDYAAPIARNAPDGAREISKARGGMPTSRKALFDAASTRARRLEKGSGPPADFDELLRKEPDGGQTNIRNTLSGHWKPWLGIASRCVVPFTSFSEFNKTADGTI